MKKKKINILGITYSIEYPCDETTLNRAAVIMFDKHIIRLANDQIPDEEMLCMIHEILEGLSHHLELDLPHGTITRLETGLFQVLTQNGVDLSPLLEEKEEVVRTSYEFEERSKQEQEEKRKRKAIEYPGGEKS